jgi:hypothetical protein
MDEGILSEELMEMLGQDAILVPKSKEDKKRKEIEIPEVKLSQRQKRKLEGLQKRK